MIPQPLWLATSAALGLVIGSFLNVVVHRLPLEGESISSPRRSRCPHCRHELPWYENVPVLSWILLRGRCSACAWAIPWRYPLVELVTGALFLLAAWLGEHRIGLVLVHWLVLSGLVVATAVDFDRFEIPDEVSIGGIVLAPVLSFVVPELHRFTRLAALWTAGWVPGHDVGRLPALGAALVGMAVGAGILLAIGWVGKRAYGREAMGLGDVKLLAAGGGFVGPGGALVSLLIGSVVASVAGVVNMLRYAWISAARARARGARRPRGRAIRVGRIAGRYVPFGPYLAIGIGITLLAWNDVAALLP